MLIDEELESLIESPSEESYLNNQVKTPTLLAAAAATVNA